MKIYLAIPYSNCEEESFRVSNEIALKLINQGNIVYSPISMCHVLNQSLLISGWKNWEKQDKAFIEWCDVVMVIILKDNGLYKIDKSEGVKAEMSYANRLNKKIIFIDEMTYTAQK